MRAASSGTSQIIAVLVKANHNMAGAGSGDKIASEARDRLST